MSAEPLYDGTELVIVDSDIRLVRIEKNRVKSKDRRVLTRKTLELLHNDIDGFLKNGLNITSGVHDQLVKYRLSLKN